MGLKAGCERFQRECCLLVTGQCKDHRCCEVTTLRYVFCKDGFWVGWGWGMGTGERFLVCQLTEDFS